MAPTVLPQPAAIPRRPAVPAPVQPGATVLPFPRPSAPAAAPAVAAPAVAPSSAAPVVPGSVLAASGTLPVAREPLSPGQAEVAPEGSRARALMDLIGRSEGTDRARGYNETLAYGAYTGGPVDLTGMTLAQVDQLQTQMLAHPQNRMNSSAAGRYQIVRTTRRELEREMGLDPATTRFTPEVQDAMARRLMERRGLGAVEEGRRTTSEFQNSMAREWASLPTTAGTGAYAGQRAAVSSEQFAAATAGTPQGVGVERQAATPVILPPAPSAMPPPAAVSGPAQPVAAVAPTPAAPAMPAPVMLAQAPAATVLPPPTIAPPVATAPAPVTDAGDAAVGAAVAGEAGGAAPTLGATQAEAPNANDNDAGGAGAARAVGESPRGGMPTQALGQPMQTEAGGSREVQGPGFTGTISAPITLTIQAAGGLDAQGVAQLARAEIEKAQRRQLDQIRRGLYD
jgi:muramidase (phage lysozyme)